MKLWDFWHPYRMEEGNYFCSGYHEQFNSFDEFVEEWGSGVCDIDYNRIHRWDFSLDEETEKPITVTFYYIMQRKACTMSVTIKVNENEQDRIKEYLKPHAELNKKLWDGIL